MTGDAENGYTFTNSHTPETIDIEGTKTWNDANDQDGKRPGKITVNLLADGDIYATKEVTRGRWLEVQFHGSSKVQKWQ